MNPNRISIKFAKPKLDQRNQDSGLFHAVGKGKLSVLYTKLEAMEPSDLEYVINSEDSSGRTLLHYAAFLNLKNIVVYLVNMGADLATEDSQKRTVIHMISYQGNIEAAQTVLHLVRHQLRKALFVSVKNLKLSIGVNTACLLHTSNLMLTASIEADRELKSRKRGFDLELKRELDGFLRKLCEFYRTVFCHVDAFGRNPIHYAALDKFTWCSKMLGTLFSYEELSGLGEFLQTFEGLQDFEWRASRKDDPKKYLCILAEVQSMLPPAQYNASFASYKSQISQVLSESCNTQDQDGNTPLHIAAFTGAYNIVRQLLVHGADKNTQNRNNLTPLDLSSTKLVMKYLTSLEEMAEEENPAGYKTLVNAGYNPNNTTNEFLMSSIHKAVASKGFVSTTLECNSDPNSFEWNLYTPLHYAAKLGSLENMQILIENGAEINALSSYKLTPLHLAAQYNQSQVIKFLAFKGAAVNMQDHTGRTPLMIAAKTGSLAGLTQLLNEGADPYIADHRHWTCLHYAGFNSKAHVDRTKIISELVKHDSDLDKLLYMKNTQGKTPLGITTTDESKLSYESTL